ncbi:cytochrome P450 [Nocardia sp. 348MFTsu5.1]|uniref:cytochrome P450 n=1 Tax=Nocardia sp. 348MFTsu5.1 TaxID=1172185 RepID=UPI00048F9618|nr:cytochrome P450 [Nocardia sp. 348MFTsu5.1]
MSRVLSTPPPDAGLRSVRGPRHLPLISTLKLIRRPADLAVSLRRGYGDIALTSALGRNVVVAQGPAAAEELTLNRDKAFSTEPVYEFALGRFFQRGVLLMDFEEHHRDRRIMQQAFTPDRLASYHRALEARIRESIRALPVGPAVDLRTVFKDLTLDIALEVFAGVELDHVEAAEINRACVDLIEAGGALIRFPVPGLRWSRGLRSRRQLEVFFGDLVAVRRSGDGNDLMSELCRAEVDGQRLSDAAVIDHMIFMIFAAHDTATIALTATAFELAKSAEWQDRVRSEVQALPETITYEDLTSMPLAELVMKEAIRLRPPVPVLPRAAVKDTELCGFHIPEGTFVVVLVGANHRIDDVWPDPTHFDPDRFRTSEHDAGRHRMAWMPFGGGVHKCMGMNFARMEVLTVLHRMLREYEWSVPQDFSMPAEDGSLTVNTGFPATVRRRSFRPSCA